MQRGILKNFAHVLPRMFAERVLWDPADLQRLLDWGSGDMKIDVMRGTCERDHSDLGSLRIARELQAWLGDQLQEQNIPPGTVGAVLEVGYTIARKDSGGWEFTIECTSTVSSAGRTYIDQFANSLGQ